MRFSFLPALRNVMFSKSVRGIQSVHSRACNIAVITTSGDWCPSQLNTLENNGFKLLLRTRAICKEHAIRCCPIHIVPRRFTCFIVARDFQRCRACNECKATPPLQHVILINVMSTAWRIYAALFTCCQNTE